MPLYVSYTNSARARVRRFYYDWHSFSLPDFHQSASWNFLCESLHHVRTCSLQRVDGFHVSFFLQHSITAVLVVATLFHSSSSDDRSLVIAMFLLLILACRPSLALLSFNFVYVPTWKCHNFSSRNPFQSWGGRLFPYRQFSVPVLLFTSSSPLSLAFGFHCRFSLRRHDSSLVLIVKIIVCINDCWLQKFVFFYFYRKNQ